MLTLFYPPRSFVQIPRPRGPKFCAAVAPLADLCLPLPSPWSPLRLARPPCDPSSLATLLVLLPFLSLRRPFPTSWLRVTVRWSSMFLPPLFSPSLLPQHLKLQVLDHLVVILALMLGLGALVRFPWRLLLLPLVLSLSFRGKLLPLLTLVLFLI
jgi:hypothetical protein